MTWLWVTLALTAGWALRARLARIDGKLRDLEWVRRTAQRDHAVHALLEAWPTESGTPVEAWETPEMQAAYDSERDRLDGVL